MALIIAGGCSDSIDTKDDTIVWKRILGTARPTGVVTVNTYHWQSAHWTDEYQYFIQIEKNSILLKKLIAQLDLIKLADKKDIDMALENSGPAWFVPNNKDSYEIWVKKGRGNIEFRLIIDKKSKDLFIAGFQA